MESKKTSDLWLYFDVISGEKAKCKLCKEVKSYKGGASSNLKKHIKARHSTIDLGGRQNTVKNVPSIITTCSASSSREVQNVSSIVTASSSNEGLSLLDTQECSEPPTKRMKTQPSMREFTTRPITISRQKKIDQVLINMIATDMQPISIVENVGFKSYTAALDPSYKLPTRKRVTEHLLQQEYESCVEIVNEILTGATYITLTTDCWTSSSTESYMAVTAHFIDANWNLQNMLLSCFKMDDRHTAANLRNEIIKTAKDWKIDRKINAIVSDNANNIVAAVGLTGWTHIPCVAHSLNLVVQSGLKSITSIHDKVKAIVAHFHRSTVASEKLKELQLQMNPNAIPLKLKMDVCTRWNSTFVMFERLCAVQEPLEAAIGVLHVPTGTLDETEWTTLRELSMLLQPFETATQHLSAEKNIAGSKVIIVLGGIYRAIDRANKKITTSTAVKVALDLLVELKYRFPRIEYNAVFSSATYLDPRFKQNGFTDDNAAKTCKKDIENQLKNVLIPSDPVERPITVNTATADDIIFGYFDKKVSNIAGTTLSDAIIEMRQYNEEQHIPRTENPLLWWKKRELLYPKMSVLAKKSLGVVASSVPSERVFSKAGLLLTDRRNRLKDKYVTKLLFINANQHL